MNSMEAASFNPCLSRKPLVILSAFEPILANCSERLGLCFLFCSRLFSFDWVDVAFVVGLAAAVGRCCAGWALSVLVGTGIGRRCCCWCCDGGDTFFFLGTCTVRE